MELRHIRYFLALAEERNFTRAARRLGIGQPPLSQQIKDLEEEVGALLFRRIPQGAQLTEAGEAFLATVRSMPAQAEAALIGARRAARGETGALRVGFTGSTAFNPIVPGIIRAYRRRFPAVDLSLREGNSPDLVAALHGDQLDAAFLRPEAVEREGLQVYDLDAEEIVAALPSSHPAASGSAIPLSVLRSDAFVLTPRNLGPTMFDAAIAACRDAGFEPVLGQFAPQIASVLAFVAAELGVSLVPKSMQTVAVHGVTYCDLADTDRPVRMALAHRRGEQSPAVRGFAAEARSVAETST